MYNTLNQASIYRNSLEDIVVVMVIRMNVDHDADVEPVSENKPTGKWICSNRGSGLKDWHRAKAEISWWEKEGKYT